MKVYFLHDTRLAAVDPSVLVDTFLDLDTLL